MKKSFLTPPPSSLAHIPFETQVERVLADLPANLPTEAEKLLISLDIDGTILTENGVTEVVRSRIKRLTDAGAHLFIATGRGLAATEDFLAELRLPTGWIVASNGALLLEVGQSGVNVFDAVLFDGSEVIDQILSHVPDALIAVERENSRTLVLAPFPEDELSGDWEVVPLEVLHTALVTKIIVRMPHLDREEFNQKMMELDLSNYQYSVGWTAWMDVMKKGVTKASRLEEMREKLGISKLGTICVGDGTNDIPMLQWAHFGVAMGDARAEVQAAAESLTGPVEQDGAGAVLEALIRHLKLV